MVEILGGSTNRWKRLLRNKTYVAHHNSREMRTFSDIPQGSVLGVALLNIFLNAVEDGKKKSLLNSTQLRGTLSMLESRTSNYLGKLEKKLKIVSAHSACEQDNALCFNRNN